MHQSRLSSETTKVIFPIGTINCIPNLKTGWQKAGEGLQTS